MADHFSDQPTAIEHQVGYVVDKLNEFIENTGEGTVVVDSITEPENEYSMCVTFRFSHNNQHTGSKQFEPEPLEEDIESNGEKLFVSVEGNDYVHILTTSTDWSAFEEDHIVGRCVGPLLKRTA